MGKVGKKLKGEKVNMTQAGVNIEGEDTATNLCIIDTLQRLGVERYYQSEIDSVLEDTYRLWQWKDKDIYSDISIHAMAFRLLRVKGYQVSSEELASYADEERMNLQTIDVATVVELYRASEERIYEEEDRSLKKLHAWTTTFLMHQLQSNSIRDQKLHKLVEYYMKNYPGIVYRIGVQKNLDLYDMRHYNRSSNPCNEDFLAFARHDFNICQAQNQKELEQLQRWYAECRLDNNNFGRDVVRVSNFIASAIISDPEFSDARLAFAKHAILVTRADDFFDLGASKEEAYSIIELVKEWKEKPCGEYSSKEVEILFKAIYSTVNELAEMAGVEQGRNVKEFLIKMWIEILSIPKIEFNARSDETLTITLDDYLSSSWVSIGCRICILMSMQFMGVKLSQEMLSSEECNDLCMHVSLVDRLLNDVQTFEKERGENIVTSVSILLAEATREGRVVSEEEAIRKIKEMAEHNMRRLMQIVYKKGSVFPRECKDIFLNACKAGCYVYWSSDEFSSPQQVMMEDMKALIHQPSLNPTDC